MSLQAEIGTIPASDKSTTATVFSSDRTISQPEIELPEGLKLNYPLEMDGLIFLSMLPSASFPVAFFDPQYRGILDKMKYGNEGKQRGKKRAELSQMTEDVIQEFINQIDKALIPSGHLFLWTDKFHLCQGFKHWFDRTSMDVVDMVVWDKRRIGMGYRTRRTGEYLIVLQKQPRKAKGVWKSRNIPDVCPEAISETNGHPHKKPIGLQAKLITAVSNEGDIIIDPAAGSFSVMDAANNSGRNFLGCDIAVKKWL